MIGRRGDDAIAGVLLAAGGGSRLGSPKALVEVGGRTLVERALATLVRSGLAPRVVVLGAGHEAVLASVDLTDHIVVTNEQWESGMAGSLSRGLTALEPRVRAVVVTLVDQPLVTAAVIRRLAAAWRAGAAAAAATYGGVRANPVLLDRALWPGVMAAAAGDVGARAYLRAHPEVVVEVACDDVGSAVDIDTPLDLAHVRRLVERGAVSP